MVDVQIGHEKTITGLLPALAGANMIYGMGMLDMGMTLSLPQFLIDNEIARMIGTSSGTTQRELQRLLKNDFVTYARKGNLVLYRLNEKNLLLKEIEGIVKKTIGIKALLRDAFSGINSVEFAFIFGSYAKNQFRSESDVDLYIIGDAQEKEFQGEIDSVEKIIQRDINYHLSGAEEFREKSGKSHFHREIVDNMILVKGNEDEFRKLIA